ncbi:MAG: imidazole glycerol phosphate synthase subunit HisH [Rhodospirillales bacterium]
MSASSVALIDYGSGNLRSAGKALERAAREAELSREIRVTDDPQAVLRADRVVLPGVGAFADCWQGLMARPGLMQAIAEAAVVRSRPFLGICVGMQLLATRGLEHGTHEGLNWIPGSVMPLEPGDPSLKIPHMGWNALSDLARHPLLDGIAAGQQAYFVHSYHFLADKPEQVLARCDHGGPVTAVIGRDTMVGTQFHPEKSQVLGLRLLANFLQWAP